MNLFIYCYWLSSDSAGCAMPTDLGGLMAAAAGSAYWFLRAA
jgi:hypothetical protein